MPFAHNTMLLDLGVGVGVGAVGVGVSGCGSRRVIFSAET